MRILISNDKNTLNETLSRFARYATIKTEFGEHVVEGNVITVPSTNDDGKPPCLMENSIEDIDVIGIRRFDLDTLGGILALSGRRADNESFWELVAYAETHGAHCIPDSNASEKDQKRIYAYFAYASHNKIIPPEDGSVKDVTTIVDEHAAAIAAIMRGDKSLMFNGRNYKREEDNLNKTSFIQENEGVIARVSPKFSNHLYRTPEGSIGKAVVAFNTSHGKITISFAQATPISAIQLAKNLWGGGAGGPNRTIAGSPQGVRMNLTEFSKAISAVQQALA